MNESIENLVHLLAIKDVIVYLVDVDEWEGNLYAYKLVADDRYADGVERMVERINREMAQYFR